MADQLKHWISRLADQRIVVIGDVILDEYVTGRATRMSREAPVPVLEFESRRYIPGGAGNPAANIVRLGSQAVQIGVVGDDTTGDALTRLLAEHGIEAHLIIDPARPTTVKSRIMAQMGLRFPQQVARVDVVSRVPISRKIEEQVANNVQDALKDARAVLLSDYHAGLLTPSLIEWIRERASRAGVLLTADAQGALHQYRNFGIVKCNADEAQDELRTPLVTDDDFAGAASKLMAQLGLTVGMVITRGGQGATIAMPDGRTKHCPAPAVQDVYDVVGAGDTTIAVLTLATGAGAPLEIATTLANHASGLVVRRVGNYAPTPDELTQALDYTAGSDAQIE